MSGIYIHIPFCKKACHYCNFHFSTSLQSKTALLNAIVKEITLFSISNKDAGEPGMVETVYFGGGTPSILEVDEVRLIMDKLREKFRVSPEAEITLEANPDDINPLRLQDYLASGINRLSVGIQSFSEAELVWMNRAHKVSDSVRCINEIKAAGFTNFSVDLIYGSPLLSHEEWRKNVMTVIEKNIPHISCYALTVEPGTALEKMITQKKKVPVDPEKQAEQFVMLMDWMQEAGYEHYEISNFAKPYLRSLHNSSYWQGKNYYGFGPSAHSFDGKNRRWNIENNAIYIKSLEKEVVPFEEESLTDIQCLNEYIMISLRTMEGLSIEKVNNDFGREFAEKLTTRISKYVDNGKILARGPNLTLTKDGKLFADGIAADLFF